MLMEENSSKFSNAIQTKQTNITANYCENESPKKAKREVHPPTSPRTKLAQYYANDRALCCTALAPGDTESTNHPSNSTNHPGNTTHSVIERAGDASESSGSWLEARLAGGCTANSEQSSTPSNKPGDGFLIHRTNLQNKRDREATDCSGAFRCTVPTTSKRASTENSALHHTAPTISNRASTDNGVCFHTALGNSKRASNRDTVIEPLVDQSIETGEDVVATTVEALVSPALRVVEKTNARKEFVSQLAGNASARFRVTAPSKLVTIDETSTTSTCTSTGTDDSLVLPTILEALVSPMVAHKMTRRPKNLLRGQTVAVQGRMDAECILDNKLQDVTSTFTQYDEDSNGKLSVEEFQKFLGDQGITIDIPDVQQAVAMIGHSSLLASPNSVDLASFTELVAHGLRAEALREEANCGYPKEEVDVLRRVFDAYDGNNTGVMEAAELGNLLQDMGQAPQTFSEQENLRAVLERILGGHLRPLRFRDFLELSKILETTSIGSGGKDQQDYQPETARRSSDRIEIARRVGLTMADVSQLENIFDDAQNGINRMLSTTEMYQLLKSRLRLKAAEGERETQVRSTIEKCKGPAGSLDFEDFMVIVGDLVDNNLATVAFILGQDSTQHLLGRMANLIK